MLFEHHLDVLAAVFTASAVSDGVRVIVLAGGADRLAHLEL